MIINIFYICISLSFILYGIKKGDKTFTTIGAMWLILFVPDFIARLLQMISERRKRRERNYIEEES